MTDPRPKKPSFSERCRRAFNDVSRKEAIDIAKDTLKDLKDPREIALLTGAIIVPGGLIGYGSYRVIKFRGKKKLPPANDNNNNDGPAKKNPPPNPPKI